MLLLPFAEADNDALHHTKRRTVVVFAVIAHYKISCSVFFFFFCFFFAFCATIWLYYRDFFSSYVRLLFAHVILLTSHTHTLAAGADDDDDGDADQTDDDDDCEVVRR